MMEVELGAGNLKYMDMQHYDNSTLARKDSMATESEISGKETDSTVAASTAGHQSATVENALVEDGTFRCQICFERNALEVSYQLPCEHRFCKECIVNYLFSKITDGQVYPTCFYIDDTLPAPAESGNGSANRYNACGKVIPTSVIEALLQDHPDLNEKYQRYKFSKENPNARECPYCTAWNVADADTLKQPAGGRLVCCNAACGKVFCFYHANAHDFDVYPTCAEYNDAMAPQLKASVDLISAVSRQCPGCQIMVMKSGGCNHMKCQCGVAFCWLCGKQIEDNLFPAHFQWWNPSACSNLQMNDDEVPSSCARINARLLAVVQFILLGPLTLASTLASSLLCCGCIVLKLTSEERGFTWVGLQSYLGTCMSSWGIFWMIMLFFLPLAVAAGSFVVSVGAAAVAITYPCYAVARIHGNHYPWPDSWTNYVRQHWLPLCARGPLFCRVLCCVVHFRPRPGTEAAAGDSNAVSDDSSVIVINEDDRGDTGGRDLQHDRPGTPRTSLDYADALAMNDIEANLEGEDGNAGGERMERGWKGKRDCSCCPPAMADGQYAVVCRLRAGSDPARALQQHTQYAALTPQVPQVPQVHVLRAGLFGARGKSGSWTHRSSQTASSDDIPGSSEDASAYAGAGLDLTAAEAAELGMSLSSSTNVTPKSPGSGCSPTYMRLDAACALSADDCEA